MSAGSDARPGFTAVVAAHESDPRLPDALASVDFADEVVLMDLGGFEGAAGLAEAAGARRIEAPRPGVVEEARAAVAPRVAHDWILFVDPDEEVADALAEDLLRFLRCADAAVGCVRVPWQFRFRGRELTTTVWGGRDQTKRVMIHRDRVRLHPDVHRGIELREGFREERIPREGGNVLHHHWCDSYGEFVEKHRRYLRHEGEARHRRGLRFSWARAAGATLGSLVRNLVRHRGLLGGVDGIALSFLHAWYTARSWMALRDHQAAVVREEG